MGVQIKYGMVLASVMAGILSMSCTGNQSKARISGRIIGGDGKNILLEQTLPAGTTVIDSVSTNPKGKFNFRVSLPSHNAIFYVLNTGNSRIPLFVSPGENISVTQLYDNSNYTVTGSSESELLRQITVILTEGAQRLDSISNSQPLDPANPAQRELSARNYMTEYYAIKRQQIAFIIQNSGSLASIYALYQRLPNDRTLFNGENDFLYYKLVADSVGKYYPASPYLLGLKSEVDQVENGRLIAGILEESLDNRAGYPELHLPDIYGVKHRLSELDGKVILLDFWTPRLEQSGQVNAELKEIYARFAGERFEIYQVCIEDSESRWVNAVQQQGLPWICVSDLRGQQSPVVNTYNLTRLPSNYLIDSNGDIVAKNLYGDDLEKAVRKSTRNLASKQS